MIRVFLAVFGMFFVPFFLYVAYEFVRSGGELKKDFLQHAPVNWLVVAGTILAVATLGSLVSTEILEYENQERATSETSGDKTPGPKQ